MCEGAIFPIFIFTQKPNQGCDKIDRRLYKEISALFYPFMIQPQHDRSGGFGNIRDIIHCGSIQGVTAVRTIQIVKIDYKELRWYFVTVFI